MEFASKTLVELPLFHAVRYELGMLGGKEDFRKYVKCELPHEVFMDLGTWYGELDWPRRRTRSSVLPETIRSRVSALRI
jgi:hypothetical protein